MKAQVTLEFLFGFAAALAVIGMLASALFLQHEKIRSRIDDAERIQAAESAARAVEAWLNTGIHMGFSFREEDISYRVESGRFHVVHEGNIIEVDGVFENNRLEPL